MALTISLGPKRKNRYFLISYGSKKIPVKVSEPAAAKALADPLNPRPENNLKETEMLFGSLSLTLEPDKATSEKTPFITRRQAIDLIQKQNPDHNYITILNIIEMKEKDFLQWNG